jgi:hypothetical protein
MQATVYVNSRAVAKYFNFALKEKKLINVPSPECGSPGLS